MPQQELFTRPSGTVEPIAPGAFLLPNLLSIDEQCQLLARCRALGDALGFYRPTVRGGGKMRMDMLCLGRHWNAQTYRYEAVRGDVDGRPAPVLPPDLADLARRVAARVAMRIEPDICLVNFYDREGRLGLHQDKDEQPDTLAAGVPVVSISIGDTARFLFGGTRRRDPVDTLLLHSGDAFVFGGPARLRYHGVSRILPGTAPAALGLTGRFNLTFRQY
ncbi:MAG TPA: alpha-ketoglutarate-dependent dioxygenase AlkB [Vicinamibacterales bacterium]|nr:alpha-ketoglutarate-dependent dioxygenase AlkB [Vicinamibacterales bacterium]